MKIDNSRIQNPDDCYIENYQSVPCKFSFCEYDKETVYPLFKPVLCREFLTDVLMSTWGRFKFAEIYGFTFHGKIPLGEAALVIYDTSKFFEKNLYDHLYEIERKLKLRPTKITFIDDNNYLVVGDKFWLSHTVLLSWYTGIMRLSVKEKLSSIEPHPFGVIKTFMKIPQVMSKIYPNDCLLFIDKTSKMTTHESNGFHAALICTSLLPDLHKGLQNDN